MRPLRFVLWVGGLVALATGAGPADAAWNNVFQVCCLGCKSPPPATSNYYAAYPAYPSYAAYMAAYPADYGSCPPPPCAQPCPQPCPPPCPRRVCETHYEQRTYYQTETHLETRTALEPVTTYTKSYFWDPVVSLRTSCYYDPCSCSYKQISTPVTSFRLREQCCPVQSWVSRCYSVPVTTCKPYTRCEPVQSCRWVYPDGTPAAPPAAPAAPPPDAGAGVLDNRPPANGAGVNDTGAGGVGGPSESQKRPFDPYNPQGYRQYVPPAAAPKAAPSKSMRPDTFVQAPPAVRLDKIVPVAPANVEGTIVRADSKPDAGARLTFKRADREGETHTVTADGAGRFKATLASGRWTVYTQRADGQLVANTRIEVREDKTSEVKLTSR
jgi:hypothetical protein